MLFHKEQGLLQHKLYHNDEIAIIRVFNFHDRESPVFNLHFILRIYSDATLILYLTKLV